MATHERPLRYQFHGHFIADLERRVVLKAGRPLANPLMAKEFDVLVFFLQNPGRVIPRDSVTPLSMKHRGRTLTADYVSKIAAKLGVKKDEMFPLTWNVGYSLGVEVRPICASDLEKSGKVFKASELHFNNHTVESMRLSLKQSLQVIDLNPTGLPAAHVTAAFDYMNLGMAAYGAEPPHAVIPEARRHAAAAFAIDPKSSRALGVLGLISMVYDFDWGSAERQLEAALKLNPRDSATLLSYAHYLIASGRPSEAVKAVETAARIDPDDLIIHASVGWIHLFAGDVEGAIVHGEDTRTLYPYFPPAYVILGWAYEAAQRFDQALEQYRISLEKEYSPAALAALGHLEAKMGNAIAGRRALNELENLLSQGRISYVPGYAKALIFAGLGEDDHSLDALDEALSQHCDWLIHLNVERRWDPLRKHGRFRKFGEKVGLISLT